MSTRNELTWPQLVLGVAAYQEMVPGDVAYMTCHRLMREQPSMLARADEAPELVLFLNRWRCRLKTGPTVAALDTWIRANAAALEDLAQLRIDDPSVPALAGEVERVYGDLLLSVKAQVPNMGGAAASKALHQLLPDLVVMWDKAIALAATADGAEGYAGFLVAMHERSRRLLAETGMTLPQAERRLADEAGSAEVKPFAKSLDEANTSLLSAP